MHYFATVFLPRSLRSVGLEFWKWVALLNDTCSFTDTSSNLCYVVRRYTMKEGLIILDKPRLVVVICFLLKYYRVKKTCRTVTTANCIRSGKGRDREGGTERIPERRRHEFSQNYPPNYESFPRFPPNSQNTQVEGLQHTRGRIKTTKRHPGISRSNCCRPKGENFKANGGGGAGT